MEGERRGGVAHGGVPHPRKWSTNRRACVVKPARSRTQMCSSRTAHSSASGTALIASVRPDTRAVVSGTMPTPTPTPVRVEPGRLRVKLHWKGGDHTALEVPKNLTGQHRWKTSATTEQLIRDLARLLPDGTIASLLNRLGVRSAKKNTWTLLRVRVFRSERKIEAYREGEHAERGELVLKEAADLLGVSKMTVTRLIKDGLLPAKQACGGAPYVIRQQDLVQPTIYRAVENGRITPKDQGDLLACTIRA